jgi:hypothetical protein
MRAAKKTGALGLVAVGFFLLGAVRCAYSPDFPNGMLKCSTSGHSCPEGYGCDTASNTCWKNGELPTGTGGAGGKGGATGTAGAGASTGTAGTGGSTGVGGMAGGGGHAGGGGAIGGGGATGTAGAGGHVGAGTPCAGTCTIKIDGAMSNSNAVSPDSKFVGHWVYQTGSTEMVACSDGSNQTNPLANDYVDVMLTSAGMLSGSYFCDWVLTPGPLDGTVLKAGQSCSRNVTDPKTGTTRFTWHGTTFNLKTADGKTGTLSATIGVDYVDDATVTGCTP